MIHGLLLAAACSWSAQARRSAEADSFSAIASDFSGEAARNIDAELVRYNRIVASPMMERVAERVVLTRLRAAGLEASLERFPSDGRITYQTFRSPMTWDVRSAELWIESAPATGFAPSRLCRYEDMPMCVCAYSKGGDWSGELVDVGAGAGPQDYEGRDVKGKVVLAYGPAFEVVRAAVIARGAAFAIIHPPPSMTGHPDLLRPGALWTKAEEAPRTSGGFEISDAQYRFLRRLMEAGSVRVRGKIDADLSAGRLTVVHAWIHGSIRPEREVLVTAHLDHPQWSANDNGSGAATLVEMARSLRGLIAAGKLPPPRATIHFMWVPEFYGVAAYLTRHPEARACRDWDDPRPRAKALMEGGPACVLADLNLDMVGEDTEKTGSRFVVTRSPASLGSGLDALMAGLLERTGRAGLFAPTGTRHPWPAGMVPYEGGSDHELFIGIGVPSTMLAHLDDWTHHTSEDTMDKTDASEFLRAGVLAETAAYRLAMDEGPPSSSPSALHVAGGPRRLALIPFDPQAFADLTGQDADWWRFQHRRVPSFDDVIFEAVNWMDGRRQTGEISRRLSREFHLNLDRAWVDHLVGILRRQGLVSD